MGERCCCGPPVNNNGGGLEWWCWTLVPLGGVSVLSGFESKSSRGASLGADDRIFLTSAFSSLRNGGGGDFRMSGSLS